MASASHDTRNKMAELTAEGIIKVLKGERPDNLCNPDVLKVRPLDQVKII